MKAARTCALVIFSACAPTLSQNSTKTNLEEAPEQDPTKTKKTESKTSPPKVAEIEDYAPVGKPYRDLVKEAPKVVSQSIPLKVRECYSFAVELEKGMEAEALTLTDPKGTKVLTTQGPVTPKQRSATQCAEFDGEYKAEVRVTKGAGTLGIQVYKHRPPSEWAASTESRRELDTLAKNVADGQPPVSQVYTMVGRTTGPAKDASFLIRLEKNSCYNFVTASDKGVEEVHLALVEPNGHVVLSDEAPSSKKHFTHCIDTGGLYRASFHIEKGEGEVSFQVFQSPTKYIPQSKSHPPRRYTPASKQSPQPNNSGRWPIIPRF